MFLDCLHFFKAIKVDFPPKFSWLVQKSGYHNRKKLDYSNCIYVYADLKPGKITVMMKHFLNCHENVTMQNRLHFLLTKFVTQL